MTFQFKSIYDNVALGLHGLQLDSIPFGPILVKIRLREGEISSYHVADSRVILPFFFSNEGKEELPNVIRRELLKEDENFCIVLAHEARVKTSPDAPEGGNAALKMRGLQTDPEARDVVFVALHHRSEGQRAGMLPIGTDRKISYAPMLEETPEITHVDVGAIDP
ncbi:MAG: hypothetical protein V4621_07565 [Pseudomonadota bacterium]